MFAHPRPRRNQREPPGLDRQLRALIEEHAQAVYQVAYGILRDRGMAEDVVQETMIKAWQSQDSFRGEASLRTWVLRIGHNTAIDALRRRRDTAVAPESLPEDEDRSAALDPQRRAAGRADLVELQAALDTLDETSRSIVILREVQRMSYAQIAETLDIGVPTVKTRLLRARRRLRSAMDNEENRR